MTSFKEQGKELQDAIDEFKAALKAEAKKLLDKIVFYLVKFKK